MDGKKSRVGVILKEVEVDGVMLNVVKCHALHEGCELKEEKF